MKKTIALLLITINLFAQDTLIKPVRYNHLPRAGVFTSVGVCTAPFIFLLPMAGDKLGQGISGTMSVISVSSLAMGGYLYFKDKPSKLNRTCHYVFMAVAGGLDGFNEETQFHYSKVKSKLPFLNDQFFNSEISWKNKWKNGDVNQGEAFLGSSTIFVGKTDWYHLGRSLNKMALVGGMITFQKGKNWKRTLLEAAISMAVYTTAKGSAHYILSR
jgi:hypothetical protein